MDICGCSSHHLLIFLTAQNRTWPAFAGIPWQVLEQYRHWDDGRAREDIGNSCGVETVLVFGGAHLERFEGVVQSAVTPWKRWLHRSAVYSMTYMSTGAAARTDARQWASKIERRGSCRRPGAVPRSGAGPEPSEADRRDRIVRIGKRCPAGAPLDSDSPAQGFGD